MRQCSLKNVTYLIEKYGKEIGFGLPINTLHQAVVNTQLVDSFFVKVTCKHSHSMNYLSVFTRLLIESFKVHFSTVLLRIFQITFFCGPLVPSVENNVPFSMFQDKTLISCSKNDLPPFNIKEDIISLMTFAEFSKSSVKNKVRNF